MLIGLNGFKQAGKDTAAEHLIDQYGFERRAFADHLKELFAAFFDIPVEWIDQYKNDPTCKVAIGWENKPELTPINAPDRMWSPMVSMTLREGLKRMGTEMMREKHNYDFWVDYLLPPLADTMKTFQGDKNTIITDTRFENELMRIKDWGGVNIRIERSGIMGEDHGSEQTPPSYLIDLVITNDGTIEELHKNMDAVYHSLRLKEALEK